MNLMRVRISCKKRLNVFCHHWSQVTLFLQPQELANHHGMDPKRTAQGSTVLPFSSLIPKGASRREMPQMPENENGIPIKNVTSCHCLINLITISAAQLTYNTIFRLEAVFWQSRTLSKTRRSVCYCYCCAVREIRILTLNFGRRRSVLIATCN